LLLLKMSKVSDGERKYVTNTYQECLNYNLRPYYGYYQIPQYFYC
jgi:hypothetical protein